MNNGLRRHIVQRVLLISLLPLLILGITVSCVMYKETVKSLESEMTQVIDIAVQRVSWEINAYINIANDAGLNTVLEKGTDVDKTVFLDNVAKHYNLQRGNFVNLEGIGLDGNDYSTRAYYLAAMQGKTYVSEPLVSKVTGKKTIIVAAPVWKDGLSGTDVVGCVYFVPDEEFLDTITRNVVVSADSVAYMIDKDGNTIAEPYAIDFLCDKNVENEVSTQDGLVALADIHSKLKKGSDGFNSITLNGAKVFIAYKPLESTNGWGLLLYAPQGDFLGAVTTSVLITVILVIIGLFTSILFSNTLGKRIGTAVKACADRLSLLTAGDLKSEIPTYKGNDEITVLVEGLGKLTEAINAIISDVSYLMGEFAKGNLVIGCYSQQVRSEYYVGDFKPILESIEQFRLQTIDVMQNISSVGSEVTGGSVQISRISQALASGATEQASSVEELAATIHNVSEEIIQNTEHCKEAITLSQQAFDNVESVSAEMQSLQAAMDGINESAQKIDTVIATIDEIAFETNIIALNAAVEAARAGAEGRGFTVVADEVRNLASKSSEAVKETAVLIENAIKAVNDGITAVNSVVGAMKEAQTCTHNVNDLIAKIGVASEKQAEGVNQVTVGVDQIASVVEQNTATAEESAAISQELEGQAKTLHSLISRYKLGDKVDRK